MYNRACHRIQRKCRFFKISHCSKRFGSSCETMGKARQPPKQACHGAYKEIQRAAEKSPTALQHNLLRILRNPKTNGLKETCLAIVSDGEIFFKRPEYLLIFNRFRGKAKKYLKLSNYTCRPTVRRPRLCSFHAKPLRLPLARRFPACS